MKTAFIPVIIAVLCAVAVGATVVPAFGQVSSALASALHIAPAEDSAGRPVNQR